MNSTLLKKVNINPNDSTIPAEFLRWNKAGGNILPGLTNRRNEEAEMYAGIKKKAMIVAAVLFAAGCLILVVWAKTS